MTPRLYVGTSGFSLWYSDDLGDTLVRLLSDSGLYSETRIFSLCTHPALPNQLLAGTDSGVYRLDLETKKWTPLAALMGPDTNVWSVAQAPDNPDVILAGTRPAMVFRSTDRGRSWKAADAALPKTCPAVLLPRVTKIQFDLADPQVVWAGLEIGGVWRSEDGGQSFWNASKGIGSDDIHDINVVRNGSTALFAATNKGLFVSQDRAESWAETAFPSPWKYTRSVVSRADGNGIVFLCNGDGPPGSTGKLLRSRDYGKQWEDATLPPGIRSCLWCVATHPSDPNLIFASTALGQYLRSKDGGESWAVLPRQLGETRALAWMPA
jgi:photosystem II stability/assembly factor-like uncharacterized protein